jgi:hypothetical protein
MNNGVQWFLSFKGELDYSFRVSKISAPGIYNDTLK